MFSVCLKKHILGEHIRIFEGMDIFQKCPENPKPHHNGNSDTPPNKCMKCDELNTDFRVICAIYILMVVILRPACAIYGLSTQRPVTDVMQMSFFLGLDFFLCKQRITCLYMEMRKYLDIKTEDADVALFV